MSASENYSRIQERMEAACVRAGRSRGEVTLIAVTKFVPVERIAPFLELGIDCIGENRVQELVQKREFFEKHGCSMHFIGQLQTNKVKYITSWVSMIQSVDRLPLAQEIERQAAKRNATQDILVEVNIGGEEQKGGAALSGIHGLLEEISLLPHIRISGLMCVPPAGTPEEARPYFRDMRKLFDTCSAKYGQAFRHLSMGMSLDYEAAIEEGATMVRIGSALFGQRQYT